MTDSFAELWSSSAPTKPTVPPQKLGTPNLQQPARRPQPDVFSMLSSAGSSAPNSRPLTPSTTARRTSPKPAVTSSGNGDPFGGLLSGTLASNASNTKMTIAERAAQVERDKLETLRRKTHTITKEVSAWDGLDTLGATNPVSQKSVVEDDDWGFGSNVTSQLTPGKPQVQSSGLDDDWGLHEFTSKPSRPSSTNPAPQPPSPMPPQPQTLLDLDSPSSRSPPKARLTPKPRKQRSDIPSLDFDFGDREDRDGLLDDDSQGEDDILGVLSKPVDAVPKRASPPTTSSRASPMPPRPPISRPPSPPPHILGQIVEMGFSIQQARVALAATETGLDVQVALETLLSNGAGSGSEMPTRDRDESEREPEGRRRPPLSRTASGNSRQTQARDTPSPSNATSQQQLQDQADKILAQASEIGLSVFNKANAFWNVGKEKALKAYEERTKSAASGAASAGGSSRPKWMQDMPAEDDSDDESGAVVGGKQDEEALPPKPAGRRPKPEPPSQQTKPRTADLFSDDTPKAYVSPFRRGRPQQAATSAPPPRAPSPVRLIRRKAVSASPGSISASGQHRSVGTEKYKLGQYSEAEAAYSNAISVLPEKHLLLVPLYNNRAMTRLKTGDYSGAIEDTTFVITLIGTSYHPAREEKVVNETEGASVDLGDGLVKALRRRAEAWEGKEKWDAARTDWECVAGCSWTTGNIRGDGVRGAGRCRRMSTVNTGGDIPAASKPKPKPPVPRHPVRRGPTPPSQALNKLREANNALEAEDQARHELKDTVDARLLAWKAGKETNIRALIANLDTVLWPELGWVKVGMGELVSPGQVKIRYTKAIAKLHPDKLTTGNTTLEQRMIANGVFGTLNEAWTAFKQ